MLTPSKTLMGSISGASILPVSGQHGARPPMDYRCFGPTSTLFLTICKSVAECPTGSVFRPSPSDDPTSSQGAGVTVPRAASRTVQAGKHFEALQKYEAGVGDETEVRKL